MEEDKKEVVEKLKSNITEKKAKIGIYILLVIIVICLLVMAYKIGIIKCHNFYVAKCGEVLKTCLL